MFNKIHRFFMVIAVLPLFVGCSDNVGFDSRPSGVNTNSSLLQGNETFLTGSGQGKPVDIIWVIDNSGSMTQEADHVRRNFLSFINYVKDRADLRLALVSKTENPQLALVLGAETGVNLPGGLDPQRFVQVDNTVSSNDGPSVALDAMDDELKGFLRPDSQKVFVFVTDDESDLSANEFRSDFDDLYPGQNFAAHGFVSLGDALSPCGDEEGEEYRDLSQQSLGQIFNVCDADWTAHFDKLAETIVAQAQSSFDLDSSLKIEEIFEVQINGAVIDPSLYTLTGSRLIVDPSAFTGAQNYTVTVSYGYE